MRTVAPLKHPRGLAPLSPDAERRQGPVRDAG